MTRKISIDGIIFHVEPVGYEMLKAYLEAWNQLNSKHKSHWEEQAAAYLLQRLRGKDAITTLEDVKGLTQVFKNIPVDHNPVARQNNSNGTRTGGLGYYLTQFALGLW